MINEIWNAHPLWLQCLCVGFVIVALTQMLLLLTRMFLVRRINNEKDHILPTSAQLPPISVIIYAHNQSEDLINNLPAIMSSQYPDFEVIVINDGSTDETKEVLMQYEQQYDHFFYTAIAEKIQTVSRRKLAILLGVKASHNEIMVMTQAQCIPANPKWLESIGRHFTEGIDAVMGPVVYDKRTGWSNRFYQWDFFDRMLEMMSLTRSIKTYGGWSYNMAFRKEAFFADKNQALQRHLTVTPGEDDLLLTAITRGRNVEVACSADALVINQHRPVDFCWSRERLRRAFSQRFYFNAPCIYHNCTVLTRILTLVSGLALAGLSAWQQAWWFLGLALFLLVVFCGYYTWINYAGSRALRVRPFTIAPMLFALWTPLVSLFFRMRVMFNSKQFYVGRLD